MGLGPQAWKEMRDSLQRILSSNEVRLSLFSGTNKCYSLNYQVCFVFALLNVNAQKEVYISVAVRHIYYLMLSSVSIRKVFKQLLCEYFPVDYKQVAKYEMKPCLRI